MPLGPMGWEYDWRAVNRYLAESTTPVFAASAAPLAGTGEKQIRLLYQAVRQVVGADICLQQTIGDCVSQGWSQARDYLACCQIAAGQREKWVATCATEPIYALSRVEVGGNRIRGDGSVGAWAAKAVTTYGTLSRMKYGSIDLSVYSGDRARKWGSAGCPDELEPVARERLIRTVSLVTSYDQARDAIANGYPVVVCSQQGFREERDADGFMRPQGTWPHCMIFIAVDDQFRRPGLLCMNSWGPHWITGPKRHDQPDGSGWVDADVADRMLRIQPDSYAASGFIGYPGSDEWSDYLTI